MNALLEPEEVKTQAAMEYIMVTGAAGYIGSVVSEELLKQGERIIALDNLSQGHRASLSGDAVFIEGDLNDSELLERIFRNYPVEAVVHLAAHTLVGESVSNPEKYFHNNVVAGLNMLNSMCRHGVNKIVFSSSCAVYGRARSSHIDESTLQSPINPYGEAKLMFERFLQWYSQAYGLRSVSLRYFNAAGASENCGESHDPETHLIPNVIKVALEQAENVSVFGTDYPTPDGSCVRDYVHVIDIARAHLLALKQMEQSAGCFAYNLGNGTGYSVLEVIEAVKKISGKEIPVVYGGRRAGDPPVLVADANLAKSKLGWEPVYPALETIIRSAYAWMKQHPHGYKAREVNDLLRVVNGYGVPEADRTTYKG
jgi:UDP-glucose 4-epimerase